MPSFIPVDYDPFAGAAEAAPKLFPADGRPSAAPGAPHPVPYNPFAGASAPTLIPVDHDPFADNPAAAPRLIPVDYDPFGTAAAPSLIPVEHDPFADNPSAAPKLVPVDYDPFAVPTPLGDKAQPPSDPSTYSGNTSFSNSTSAPQSSFYGKLYPATNADLKARLANQNSSPLGALMQSQSLDELAQNLSPYCRKIRGLCTDRCIDTLPTLDYGFRFWNCVSDCMASFGCPSVRGP